MEFRARACETPDACESGIGELGLTPRPGPTGAAPSRGQRGGAGGAPTVSALGETLPVASTVNQRLGHGPAAAHRLGYNAGRQRTAFTF